MIGPCIVPYGTGIDYIGNALRASVKEPLDWTVREKKAVATKLLAFSGGTVKRLPKLDKNKYKNVEIFHNLEVGDVVNKYRTNLDGCGYIIVRSDKVDEAECIATSILEDVREYVFKD